MTDSFRSQAEPDATEYGLRFRLRVFSAFLLALPTLPRAVWVQRHEIVNALFGRHVWLGKKARAQFEAQQADVARWRQELYGR